MASLVPGQRLEARCTRCKDITGHVIVILDATGTPAKVQCFACGSVHKYYPPEGPKKAPKEKTLRVKSGQERSHVVEVAAKQTAPRSLSASGTPKAPRKSTAKTPVKGVDNEAQWRKVMDVYAGGFKTYAMDASFTQGEGVQHSVFGKGIVYSVLPPDKVTIIFQDGLKNLRCRC